MEITRELLEERLVGLITHRDTLQRHLDMQNGAIEDCKQLLEVLTGEAQEEPEEEEEP